jgi:fatty-acyl-CoA synthase
VTDWNYADAWEAVAETQPGAEAIVQGQRRVTWEEFDRRAEAVAGYLLDQGVSQQDKVALYLYNSPEYLESVFACFKIGLVPVNTNYRYEEDELTYLWVNADAVAVVFHGTFTEMVERVRPRTPLVTSWLWVDDGSGPCPEWALPYESVHGAGTARATAPWKRSGDDILMLYTGGTTGVPKGVMWRQDDLFARLNRAGARSYGDDGSPADVRRIVGAEGPGPTLLPACPLMHGTGSFTAFECLAEGGRVVLLEQRHYDPAELLRTVGDEQVNMVVIVGDPFARPLVATLDANPGSFDLSSLRAITSSGAMWSEEIKVGLLAHHGAMLLVDAFSSSEALGMGVSVSAAGFASHTAEFTLGPDVRVLDGDNHDVEPGSDVVGVLALGGRNPLGYYKDAEKSAATFRVVDGVRYSVPGDFAQIRADGSIRLLGRGSGCINTAGEKVYPEEVEEVLKTHVAVADAAVVGVPDLNYGEQIVAAVECYDEAPDAAELIDHVKAHLAHYKAPRHVRVVGSVGRSPSGKLDYGRHRSEAQAWLASDATS